MKRFVPEIVVLSFLNWERRRRYISLELVVVDFSSMRATVSVVTAAMAFSRRVILCAKSFLALNLIRNPVLRSATGTSCSPGTVMAT
jgi:hypothetical protein